MITSPGSILNGLSPKEISVKTGWSKSQTGLSGDIIEKLHGGGDEGTVDLFKASKELLNYHPRSQSNGCMQPAPNPYGLIGRKSVTNAASTESSLFSSSLSEIFSQKCKTLFCVC